MSNQNENQTPQRHEGNQGGTPAPQSNPNPGRDQQTDRTNTNNPAEQSQRGGQQSEGYETPQQPMGFAAHTSNQQPQAEGDKQKSGGGASGYDVNREQEQVNQEREDMNSERNLDDLKIDTNRPSETNTPETQPGTDQNQANNPGNTRA